MEKFMKHRILDWKTWALGLWAGIISGFSTSGLSALGISGLEMAGVKIAQLDIRQALTIASVGGLVGAFLYLKQSPVPKEIEIDEP
jgi:hypothetical protein